MAGKAHRLETEARGIPAVTALTTRASSPWTTSGQKAKREAKASRDRWTNLGLDGIAYMPKAVVTGTGKRSNRMKTNKVTITYRAPAPRLTIEHDYTTK